MAIKSRKDDFIEFQQELQRKENKANSGFWAWIVFFLGVNLFVVTSVLGIYTASAIGSVNDLQTVLTDNDVKQQPAFKEQMVQYFDMATGVAVGDQDKINEYMGISYGSGYSVRGTSIQIDVGSDEVGEWPAEERAETVQSSQLQSQYLQDFQQMLAGEGVNLQYYVKRSNGAVVTNTEHQLLSENGQVILPKGYDYFLAFNGQELSGYYEKDGYFNLQDNGFSDINGIAFAKQYQEGSNYMSRYPELAQCQIVMVVKTDLEENYYGYSALYWIKDQIMLQRYCLIVGMILWGISVLMLVASVLTRKSKRRFDMILMEFSARIWMEFKIVAAIFVVTGVIATVGTTLSDMFYYINWWYTWFNCLLYMCLGLFCFWVLYILLLDLGINKKDFFRHNMINSYLDLIHSKEVLQPFQERLLKRFYTLIGTELALLLVTIVTCWTLVIPIFTISFGIFLLVRYIKQYKELIEDLGKVCGQIERIKGGDMDTPIHLSPQADLYPVAQNLNSIQEGVVMATEQKMKSERMKIDLVTNVSHDLKTPLTSIISYTDLLSHEEGLSDAAKDYVRILRQKSDRLKALINDLFDLSKATSANLEVSLERIDFGKLLSQVTAELADEIEQSQLVVKVNIPNEPIPIISDGAKMHRIFDNLLINALKYSLEGSRVYVDLRVENGLATAVIKNTAKYEMDFDAETVIGRFVRGDKARSTEGSGLGLAIAQSYTEACGGRFDLSIDGDLFKVAVTFDTEAARQSMVPEPEEMVSVEEESPLEVSELDTEKEV